MHTNTLGNIYKHVVNRISLLPMWLKWIVGIGILLLIGGIVAFAMLQQVKPTPTLIEKGGSAPAYTSITPQDHTPLKADPKKEGAESKKESLLKPPSAKSNSQTSTNNQQQSTPNSGESNTPVDTPQIPTIPVSSFPNASSTGPSGCGSYTDYSGTLNITTNGTVLSCIRLNGLLTINADNVTVQNSILNGTTWWGIRVGNTKTNATNFKLLHSKLSTIPGNGPDAGGYDYGVAQESTGTMEIGYNDISGYKDGVTISNGNIHNNYIHNLSQFTGAHTQAVYVYPGTSRVTINHNTLINDSPLSQATAAIYIAPDAGHQNDRLITNNLLAGGAYTIYGGDSTATNIVVSDNKFSVQRYPNSGYYGWVAYWQAGNSGVSWINNTWADGARINQTLSP